VIVVDTGALVALIDRDDANHARLRAAFEKNPEDWILPWAILPEADYLVATHLGSDAAEALRNDLAQGLFTIDWEGAADLERARELNEIYADLSLGLVDGIVMATAERLGARAIATLDLRAFGPVQLAGRPELWPRDL
jgi:predicted nucleic acid-binding protein